MSVNPQMVDWIAIDWGTSKFRAWAMSADNTILASCENDLGMSGLQKHEYEKIVVNCCELWLAKQAKKVPVIVCGMAGSREGWKQIPYKSVPFSMQEGCPLYAVETKDQRIAVYIIAGLKQSQPADVMRGEETQIFGLITQQPDFDGVMVLPGTHTKWAWVKQQRIDRFATYMTGDLFSVLSEHSILNRVLTTDHFSERDFDQSVLATLNKPSYMTQQLFELRALSVLENTAPEKLRARLSGSLIGLELASMKPLLKKDASISIIGADVFALLYQRALRLIDIDSQALSSESVTLAGLHTAYLSLSQPALEESLCDH